MHPKKIALVLVIVASFAALLGGKFLRERVEVPELRHDRNIPPLMKQPRYERVWHNSAISKKLTIGGQRRLQKVVKALSGRDGTFYLLDMGAKQIKKFSSNGVLLSIYGNRKDLFLPMDFLVDESGKVWVADPMEGSIKIFTPEGVLTQSLRPSRPIYRLAADSNGSILAMHTPIGGALFSILDHMHPDKISELPIGNLLVDQDRRAIVLDGLISSGGDGGFVYAPLHFGALLGLDAAGSVRFFRETLDREPMPNVFTSSDGTFIDPEAPMATLEMSVVDKSIYILTILETGLTRKKIFDVYDYKQGEYQYSFEIPATADSAFVVKGGILTLDNATLTLWSFGDVPEKKGVGPL